MFMLPGTDGTLLMSVSHVDDTSRVHLAWHRREDVEALITVTADPLRFADEVARLRDNSVGTCEFAALSITSSAQQLQLLPDGIMRLLWDRDLNPDTIQITYPVALDGAAPPFRVFVQSVPFMENVARMRRQLVTAE